MQLNFTGITPAETKSGEQNDQRQNLNAFAVHQPAQWHNGDEAVGGVGQLVRLWLKLARINSCKTGSGQRIRINGSTVYIYNAFGWGTQFTGTHSCTCKKQKRAEEWWYARAWLTQHNT
jgi:hypothetical protein